ncbi:hypothetical protein DQG23_01960 [Paenibacillus contaminans]|uniref:Transposase putative helix-turn-helix domain-containing protein n=2 Tax=Paenibacillus contaminans TaxID=450362 RepID=A0A329MTW2_9BACL|nr:hypothetical protein DQG23_01960 [Paenibacillus contaminans]
MIRQTFGCLRFLYNQILAECKNKSKYDHAYAERPNRQTYRTPATFKTDFDWLREVEPQIQGKRGEQRDPMCQNGVSSFKSRSGSAVCMQPDFGGNLEPVSDRLQKLYAAAQKEMDRKD